jgi:dihydrofolate reductase
LGSRTALTDLARPLAPLPPQAAGGKDVRIAGGANVVQQFLEAGLVDEIQVHLAPVLLGDGVRLFERIGAGPVELEITRVIDSPRITHLRYRVVR